MSWGAIIGGVVAAGGSALAASSGGSGSAPAPVQANPGVSLLQYIKGLKKGLPGLTDLESEYRPQYGELNLADQGQYLTGLLGMGGTAAGASQQQLGAARDADLADQLGNTGSALSILGAINPNGKAAADRATTMANDAYNRSLSISPQEKRASDQQAREAFGARGRINDNASIVGELLGREDVMAAKRAEASAANNNAFNLQSQYASPALSLLGGIPASVALGQDYLSASRGAIGQNVPQLINPDAGINLGMANASNLNSYNLANASLKQQQAAQWGQIASNIGGNIAKYWGQS